MSTSRGTRTAAPWTRDPALAFAAGGAVVIGVVLRHALAGEVFFRRDVHLMWYTQVETAARAVVAGEWPLWNADIGFGQPLWADANVQILYPLTWLNLVLRPWTYYTVFVVAHLALAAAGARALARTLGLGPWAAAAGALLWLASGPLLSLSEVWNQLAGAAWLPWALAWGIRALESRRRRPALAAGAALAAQVLAGSPEAALLTVAGGLAYVALARGWGERRLGGGDTVRAACIAAAVGIGLSAGQWLPSVLAAAGSARAHLPPEAQAYWSVHPAGLVQLLLPLAADALRLRPPIAAVMFGGRDPLLPSLYLGACTVPLAVAAVLGGRRRAAVALLLVFAAALALALGPYGLLQPLLAALLPPIRALRYPIKAMPAAALAWALVCAVGVEAWTSGEPEPRRRRLFLIAPVALLATAAAAAVLLLSLRAELVAARLLEGSALPASRLLAPARQSLAVAGAASLATLTVLVAHLRARLAAPVAAALVGTIAVAELTAAHAGLVLTAPRALYTTRPPIAEVARPPDHGRLYAYDDFEPGRSLAYLGRAEPFAIVRAPVGWSVAAATALSMRLALFPPTAAPLGIAGSFDHDTPGIAPSRSAALLDTLLSLEGTPAHTRLLALGAVSRVAALHTGGLESLTPLASGDALLAEPVRVMAVPAARPRAWAVPSARVVPADADALRAILDPAFDPTAEVVLADGSPPAAGAAGFSSRVQVDHVGTDGISIGAELNQAGYVVLADAWAPGWAALVDGRDQAVHRANFGFRAVEVPAGTHRVEMRYRPPGLAPGLVLTAMTAVAVIMAARRRPAGTSPAKVAS